MYVDILFVENFLINYIILYLTKRFSKNDTKNINLFFGSLCGSLYILTIFLSVPHIFYSFSAKIIISFLIIAISFKIQRIADFIRLLSIFYLITFIIGGTAFALIYLVNFNFNQIIISAIIISVLLIYINWGYITKRNTNSVLIHVLKINVLNMSRDIKAIIDTGNSLCDPLSNRPVIVVEYDAIKELLPEGIKMLYKNGQFNDLFKIPDVIHEDGWINRLRIIPFMSLGMDKGLLLGFKPDFVNVDNNKKDIKDVIVGICFNKLNKSGEYEALIGPEILC
ncbi:sigma-E processing peptidase SpoIIGA [Aceticella autotrophica]|uniref:Sporulation sigma-E factor-processing peptidase n=1 Tax=Aceticella autotrophica TaxID=2755338 RepID=A0A975GB90_9THEO|nr:sigma-E processing peptidase SpoIIGA [Aceticella autotrophica]QSZ27927.1 sigma-E processing peptidase SpoIIGA [Aceticella autotrophica]